MRKKKITQISAIAMAMAMAVTPTANVLLMEKHQETAHCSLTHRRFQIIVLGKIQFGN